MHKKLESRQVHDVNLPAEIYVKYEDYILKRTIKRSISLSSLFFNEYMLFASNLKKK